MKTENLMLITDARAVLLNTAVADAKQNPLAAAFLGWLLQGDDLLALLEEAATRAAAAKGAEAKSSDSTCCADLRSAPLRRCGPCSGFLQQRQQVVSLEQPSRKAAASGFCFASATAVLSKPHARR